MLCPPRAHHVPLLSSRWPPLLPSSPPALTQLMALCALVVALIYGHVWFYATPCLASERISHVNHDSLRYKATIAVIWIPLNGTLMTWHASFAHAVIWLALAQRMLLWTPVPGRIPHK
eukprot:7662873-Alexandrium_andersonii.AAC.2